MTSRSITFRIRPEVLRERIAEVVQMATQKIAMQCLRGVVLRTPVDTGRARSNWNVSLDGPDTSEQGIDSAEGIISAGSSAILASKPYATIYISNGLPYITALEYGHSKQAPGGMVRLTLDQVAAQFERPSL